MGKNFGRKEGTYIYLEFFFNNRRQVRRFFSISDTQSLDVFKRSQLQAMTRISTYKLT